MASERTVLAFDTSAAHCAAALLCAGKIVASRRLEMGRGQAEALMPLLKDLLREGGRSWGNLDALGVGIGPGNFTGIRIAVSAARGLAMGLGIPAHGVSGFEALALGHDRPLCAALPAPRGHVYAQVFFAETTDNAVHADKAEFADMSAGLTVVSADPQTVAGAPARHPVAEAIALIAAARKPGAVPAPAPLYLKSADAAPPRDPAPVLLP